MSRKKFSIGVWGYSKEAVNEYIKEVDSRVKRQLLKKDEEIERLNTQLEILKEKNAVMIAEKTAVSEALVEARLTAEKIKIEAKEQAVEILSQAERKAKEEVKLIKEEILQQQKKAEEEFNRVKAEIKQRYEAELIQVKRLRSELKLLKTAAAVIVNNSEKDALNSKRTIHRILNASSRSSESVSIEELEGLI